jgi:hypothetical protein
MRIGLLFPARITAAATVKMSTGVDGTAALFCGLINASGDGVTNTSAPAVNADLMCEIDGMILCSGSGTLHVYRAGELTTASGSYLRQGGVGMIWNMT